MKKLLTLTIALFAVMATTAQKAHLRTKNFTTRDGLASNVVNCGLQDRQGYIWFGTNHGLTRFDGHRFANFYVEKDGERQVEGVVDIVEDTLRNVLLLAGNGYKLLCFDLGKMQFVSAEGMTFPKDPGKEQREQAFTAHALELGIDRGNKTNRRHDLHYARLNDGCELFATIDNGFFVYDGIQVRHYSATDNQPVIESDYINGILQDHSGGVWLLTTFAGVYRLELGEEALLHHTLSPNIRSFAQLDDHTIAVADMEGHVYRYDTDTRQSSLLFDKGVRAYAINTDSKGWRWIGTRGKGVWIIEESNHLKIKKLENLPTRQIYDIKFSRNGTAWIATLDGGLIEVHEKPDGEFIYLQYLQGQGIHEIDIDPMGRLWMATESGVLMKDGMDTDTIFNKGKAVCICHAPNGTIWAGTNGYGLIKIVHRKNTDENELSYIQADEGLANNCVESVVCDSKGNVIAGTDQGISIVGSDGSVRNIYSQQGLRADTYNENAILCTTNGRIFLGNLTGLVELRTTTTDLTNREIGAPYITCVEVNNVLHYDLLSANSSGEIRLSHDENNLCFSFSSFAYRDLSSVIYSYWLEGVDHDWRPSTKESQALFTNLSPGHYRLHVRSRLAGTSWSEESVCDIYITQPWYWTWWARAFYLLVIALIIWYELHQYQQRLSLRRQLDQRLAALYAVEAQQDQDSTSSAVESETADTMEHEEQVEKEETHDHIDHTPAEPESIVPEHKSSQKDKAFLYKLDRLILENMLLTDLDVNFIAQEMCMSYSTLHRRIKSLTGMTANEYVRKHRLAKAMQLLHDGHNATEVSLQCGFNSPSYFTRCFKAEYGMLPSEVGI